MNQPNLTDWLTVFIAFFTFVAAAAALEIARKQLSGLRREIKVNSFVMLLQLESDMTNRKASAEDAAFNLFELCKPGTDVDSHKIEAYEMRLNGCIENWFNTADRLAFLILKGYVKENDFRPEYAPYFSKMVSEQSKWFQSDTTYTNITALCDRWGIVIPAYKPEE